MNNLDQDQPQQELKILQQFQTPQLNNMKQQQNPVLFEYNSDKIQEKKQYQKGGQSPLQSKFSFDLSSAKSADCNIKLFRKDSEDVNDSTDSTTQSQDIFQNLTDSQILRSRKKSIIKNKFNLQVQTSFNKSLYSSKYQNQSRENSAKESQSNSSKSIIDDITFFQQDQIIEDNQFQISEIYEQLENQVTTQDTIQQQQQQFQEMQQNEHNSEILSIKCQSICSIKSRILEMQLKQSQFNQQYEIIEEIGDGIQAVVTKVRHKNTNKIYAAKTFRVLDEEISQQIQNEFEMIQPLTHKGILQVYDLIDMDTQPTIIMEFFDGQNIMKQKIDDFKIKQKMNIMLQLLEIVAFIHKEKIIHRDIQLRNILLNVETQEIKLIDFGIAKKSIENFLSFSQCGYRHYQAPEMINCETYSNKVDIWQLGQVFYEILENTQIHSKKLILSIQKQCLEFENTPKTLQDLILKFLEIESDKRINIQVAIVELSKIIQTLGNEL